MKIRLPAVRLGAAFAIVALSWSPGALALNPELDVSQYAHTAWRIREGFTKDYAASLAQTPDGYLWLATMFGPVRFDGARAVPWSPAGYGPQETLVPRLFAARDGTLWVAGYPGLASWKDGKRIDHPELVNLLVSTLFEDRAGTLWVGAGPLGGPTRLCAREQGRFQCRGEDGSLGRWVSALLEDGKGQLWVLTTAGLWRWAPGLPLLVPLPELPMDGPRSLAEGDNGELLVATRAGIRRVSDGKVGELLVRSDESTGVIRGMLRDRGGALWIGTSNGGVLHARRDSVDVFTEANGLSGNGILDLFEDREGTVWISTTEGLDRFRELAAATITAGQGLPRGGIMSVLGTRDGSVWVSASSAVAWQHDGQWVVRRTPHDKQLPGLPAGSGSLFQDSRGRVWFGGHAAFGYFENDRFNAVGGVPGGYVDEIGEDRTGNLWIAHRSAGLLRISPNLEVQRTSWAAVGGGKFARRIAVDPVRGGLWLGYLENGVALLVDGKIRASYSAADGLGRGIVNQVRVDADGAVWAATEGGLSRLKNGRWATLSSKNGLPCDMVNWMIGGDDVWLYLGCGVARIGRAELDAWAAAADEGKAADRAVRATVFDHSDGIRSVRIPASYTPSAARATDGKLWFVAPGGMSVLDPRNLPRNALPPPVHIEEVVADRKPYAAAGGNRGPVHLPPLVRDLQIDYTATSLVAPEKMRFRYRLDGWDRDWVEAGTRRQAFYSDLPPGDYHFRVSASNNSGVWNEAGASVAFAIAPAYYQTAWFRLLIVAALAAALWAAYRWRVRVLAARLSEVQSENRERRRAEEALRESDGRFRVLTDLSSDWYWQQDENLRFTYISSGANTRSVYPADVSIGKTRWELSNVTPLSGSWAEHEAVVAARQPFRDFEIRRLDEDGTTRYVSVSGAPIFDEEGRFKGYQGVGRNITERKRIEEALRELTERLQLGQAAMRMIIMDWNVKEDLLSWSDSPEWLRGPMPPSGRYPFFKDQVHPEDRDSFLASRRHALETLQVRTTEYRLVRTDGEVIWLLERKYAFAGVEGNAVRMLAAMVDITDRKRAEEALRLSEERYALAMRASGEGHWDWKIPTGEFYVSPRYLEFLRLPPDTKFSGRADFVQQLPFHPEDRTAYGAAVAAHFAGDTPRVDMVIRLLPKGQMRWLHVIGVCSRNADGKPVRWAGSVSDVTERERAEEELRRSRHYLAEAQRLSHIGSWAFNSSGFGHWSPELFKIHGLDPGGKAPSIPEYLALVHPDDRDAVVHEIENLLGGAEGFDFTKRIVRPDGTIRRVRCIGRRATPDGVVPEFIGTGMDITEQEQAAEELRRLEGQLRQAQRLEAMGTLAGGIAHDFNNILGAILGYGEMALRGAREGTRLRRDLDSIMAAGERGRSLVDRVLAFSRSGVGERVPVHVEKVVSETVGLIEARLPAGVRVEAKLEAGRSAIVGEATQVHQVMMNLGTNAVQAMPAGGTLSVALEVMRCEVARAATVGNLAAGEYIRLTVGDTGGGIPQEIIDRIFDPFFTTKEAGVGTGLGLSLVHGIVMDLGGALDVMSAPGEGSTFTVFIPRTGEVVANDEERREPALPHGTGERVLVVDDEEPLVRLTTETLDELGYAAVGFTSSAAALDAFRSDPGGFDAVITDERMPGMSGAALIREVRRVRQSIPILLVSGYTGGLVMNRALDEGANEVLKKPLSARDLAASLARVLHA